MLEQGAQIQCSRALSHQVDNASPWDTTYLGGSIFLLVGQKPQLEGSPREMNWGTPVLKDAL